MSGLPLGGHVFSACAAAPETPSSPAGSGSPCGSRQEGRKSSMGGRVARAAPRDRAQGGAGAVDKSPQTGIGLSTEEDRERARGGLDLSTRIHIFHRTISPPGLDRLVLRG